MTEERVLTPAVDDADERRARVIALSGAAGFSAVLLAFWAWWPAGVALGLTAGCLIVFRIGRAMQANALAEPSEDLQGFLGEDDLQHEFRRLRVRLGDDWPVFSRAAVLVTQAQWASVAGLQRELRIGSSAAQQLMAQLEAEGFVGPSRGTRPRIVRLPRDKAGELERMLRS